MSAQKPMAERMEEMLVRLQKYNGTLVTALDRKVLKRLIKQGKARIENTGSPKSMNCFGSTSTRSVAMATNPAPLEKVTETEGPYAKRRAAMEASGLNYRGKNWGKVRVDLPREEREKKISDKKLMWKKLKDWRT